MPDSNFPATAGPSAFYVLGHNPNSIAEVNAALDAGANAIEPDINVYEDRPQEFCVSEVNLLDPDGGGPSDAPSLEQYLTGLHDIAVRRPELALVVFDCKPKIATPAYGAALLKTVRTLLTFDTDLNVIVSVAMRSEAAMFQTVGGNLEPREGAMIDEENDPVAVSHALAAAGAKNPSFGNGISFLNVLLGPHVRPSMERACEFRAATDRLRFIYVWTVNDGDLMREYIRIGVDGIVTVEPAKLRGILRESQFQTLVRLATRADNPFERPNLAYGLQIHTGDQMDASPATNVTFTLTGTAGSASVTMDTSLPGRMTSGASNYLTLPSGDLGELRSITVQRDSVGQDQDWLLERIQVESFRYGVSKQAGFNRWIDSTAPFTQPLA